MIERRLGASATSLLVLASACGSGPREEPPDLSLELRERLAALSPVELPAARPDATNAYADDAAAARLGQQLFFDPRFSGPLLDEDNTGTVGTLGVQGEAGRVSCESCHQVDADFQDNRSPRRGLSLASGWTRRRAPSLLDFGQSPLLAWDGRHDTGYGQIFAVIESPLEWNSSRLFVAQQVARYYRAEYEAVFGALPALDAYDALAAADAGCASLPADPMTERCPKPGQDDAAVIRILVNVGKAISAYERELRCGPSRFDAWMHGQADALSPQEQAGALVFVRAGCDTCHAGPYLSDEAFHNVGAANLFPSFIAPYDDPGAALGLLAARQDPLGSRSEFSDGDDGRLDAAPSDYAALDGAFRTPRLRCVSRRPSFMHAGQLRTLEDVVLFFDRGGDSRGYRGVKDALITPLGLSDDARAELVAFLRALDGAGADTALREKPILPGETP